MHKSGILLILIYLGIWSFSANLKSQVPDDILVNEAELVSRYNSILQEPLNARAEKANDFFQAFFDLLQDENSFEYPFDSLRKIGKVYSPDKRIRIYTWNIPNNVNQNLYFGIIQYYSKQNKAYRLVDLNKLPEPAIYRLNRNWNGSLYYQIVENKHAGQVYYTLLGYDLNDILSNKKVIEIISIDKFDQIYFCEKLIQYEEKIVDRVVFEYNEKATMSLRFNPELKMIVFDHLSPQKPSLEGKYQFYGPDFTYDGLKFEKGIWVHYENIDVTN